MSWSSAYALYAYAVEVCDLPLRDEIKALLNGDDEDEEQYQDIDDVLEALHNGYLNGPVYDKLKNIGCTSWRIFYGPDVSRYIGYAAIMPYEQPLMTKDEMDKEIYDTLTYLCGEKYAEENKPEEVYKVWIE